MSFYTLVLGLMGHDSSVSLFEDDKLIYFNATERFNRIKHSSNFDRSCIDFVLDNITNKIDLVMVAKENFAERFMNGFSGKLDLNKIKYLVHFNNTLFNANNEPCHHDYHAYAAFYMSPFKEAVCLVIDGSGSSSDLNYELNTWNIFLQETTSIIEIDSEYQKKDLYKRGRLRQTRLYNHPEISQKPQMMVNCHGSASDEKYEEYFSKFNFKTEFTPHLDIGDIYIGACLFSGYTSLDAGKIMGLSAYGNPDNNLPKVFYGDTLLGDCNLFYPHPLRNVNTFIHPNLKNPSFQTKADFSYNTQKALEKTFLCRAEFIAKNSKIKNLILTGGCALNILGASLIKEKFPEFNIFVDPIASDSAQSIGIGIYGYKRYGNDNKLKKQNHFDSIYLGPKYDNDLMNQQIKNNIEKYNAAS